MTDTQYNTLSYLKGWMLPPLCLSLLLYLDLYLKQTHTQIISVRAVCPGGVCVEVGPGVEDIHVAVAVTLSRTSLLQVTSDLTQILDLCLKGLDLMHTHTHTHASSVK